MSEYERTITIRALSVDVFGFIADVTNLPNYLPSVKKATQEEGERVRIKGVAAGRPFEVDGFFHIDRLRRRIEWGSDGEFQYRGWMEIIPASDPVNSILKVHLSFEPGREMAEEMDRRTGDHGRAILEGIERALITIRAYCEGQVSRAGSSGRD